MRRSALRSPCPAPHRASLPNSISRWAAKPIISRRNVASEPFSRSVRRAILSSVIVVILRSELRVQPNPTQDRHGGRRPARLRQTLGGRSGGPISGLLHHHQGHNQNCRSTRQGLDRCPGGYSTGAYELVGCPHARLVLPLPDFTRQPLETGSQL